VDYFDPTFDSEMIFGGCGALIFVIDAQVTATHAVVFFYKRVQFNGTVSALIYGNMYIHKIIRVDMCKLIRVNVT
jgi:Ras-related GTP-binding protein C/D